MGIDNRDIARKLDTRLDLDDQACRLAKQLGLRVAISTDAHSTMALGLIGFWRQYDARHRHGRATTLSMAAAMAIRRANYSSVN